MAVNAKKGHGASWVMRGSPWRIEHWLRKRPSERRADQLDTRVDCRFVQPAPSATSSLGAQAKVPVSAALGYQTRAETANRFEGHTITSFPFGLSLNSGDAFPDTKGEIDVEGDS